MLTQKSSPAGAPSVATASATAATPTVGSHTHAGSAPRDLGSAICYFEGRIQLSVPPSIN